MSLVLDAYEILNDISLPVLERLGKVEDEALFSLTPDFRSTLLSELTTDFNKENDAAVISLHRLLLHRTYPEDVAERDRKIACDFWSQFSSVNHEGLTVRDVFKEAASQSFKILDIAMDFSLSETSWSKNSPVDLLFTGIVAPRLSGEEDNYSTIFHINTDHRYWHESFFNEENSFTKLASCALHEVTHIEQLVRMESSDPEEFYCVMDKEWLQLTPMLSIREIYRYTLHERQAFYRMNAVERLAKGQSIVSEYEDCRINGMMLP